MSCGAATRVIHHFTSDGCRAAGTGSRFASAGILASSSQFWSLPTALLGGMSAAAGIAAVNCFANLAGFFSPAIVGWLNDFTGKSTAGLIFISIAVTLGALLVFLVPAKSVNR